MAKVRIVTTIIADTLSDAERAMTVLSPIFKEVIINGLAMDLSVDTITDPVVASPVTELAE